MYKWSAGHNMPGYLPESDPVLFDTRLDAVEYMISELDGIADSMYGEDQDEAAEEYSAAAVSLRSHDGDVDGDWYDTFEDGRIAYWIECVDVPEGEDF